VRAAVALGVSVATGACAPAPLSELAVGLVVPPPSLAQPDITNAKMGTVARYPRMLSPQD
jgi:hypothetical protein